MRFIDNSRVHDHVRQNLLATGKGTNPEPDPPILGNNANECGDAMARVVAPGVDLQNISSNWKKLQATLKQKDESHPQKGKPNIVSKHGEVRNKKRGHDHLNERKSYESDSKQKHKRSKTMGLETSKPVMPLPSASLALWAEDNDIPAKDLAEAYGPLSKTTSIPPVPVLESKDDTNAGLSPTVEVGKYLAIDCEMVGVGPNPNDESALARVSIVNYHGHQVYDSFVQPKEAVTDYRTHISGITPKLLQSARTLEVVQRDVAGLLDGSILIGHAVRNDLDALMLGHPKRDIRDTSRHSTYRRLVGGKTPGLKRLATDVLGIEIQGGEHSSVEDARATMLLFRKEKENFERDHVAKWGHDRRGGGDESAQHEVKKAKTEKKKKKKKGKK